MSAVALVVESTTNGADVAIEADEVAGGGGRGRPSRRTPTPTPIGDE